MRQECKWCLCVIKDVVEEHQNWKKEKQAGEVIRQLEEISNDVNCKDKVCIPLRRAAKVYYGRGKDGN